MQALSRLSINPYSFTFRSLIHSQINGSHLLLVGFYTMDWTFKYSASRFVALLLHYMSLVRHFYPKRLTYSFLWAIPTGPIWGEVSQGHNDMLTAVGFEPVTPWSEHQRTNPLRNSPPIVADNMYRLAVNKGGLPWLVSTAHVTRRWASVCT